MLVDASPLIYLAKIHALDVFAEAGHVPLITQEVERETARPGLAYEHPDSMLIAAAIRSGVLQRTRLSQAEIQASERLVGAAGGINAGEAQVLAASHQRGLPALLFERRATRLARSMGVETWMPIDILFAGTSDRTLLAERVSGFAQLVQMRLTDAQGLLDLIEEAER